MLSDEFIQPTTYRPNHRFAYINEPDDIKYVYTKNHHRQHESKENAPLNVTPTIPLNVLPPPPHKLNNTRNHSKRTNRRSCNGRSDSPLGYESDESYKSHTSQGRLHKNGLGNFGNFQRSEFCLYNQVQMFGKFSQSALDMNKDSNLGLQPNFLKQNKKIRYYDSKQSKSDAEEIKRRVYGLMERFNSRVHCFKIDPHPTGLFTGSPFDNLSSQIWNVYTTKAQTIQTYQNKLKFWQQVYFEITKALTKFSLFLVGSTMSGLGTNDSDIDMCLLVKTWSPDQRNQAICYLEQIRDILERCDFVLQPRVIPAKVPILKFTGAQHGFEVDLNCNNSVGIRNTYMLHCYAQLDWRVRPLVVLVKIWAQANDINDAKKMTISSYSLALMVIHYLQCGVAPPVVPCLHGLRPDKFNASTEIWCIDFQENLPKFTSDNKMSLGELLLGFLHYYTYFNYGCYAISVRAGSKLPIDECRYTRSTKNDPHQWKLLCIEEPFDLTNTARSVYDAAEFKRIRDVFYNSYKILSNTHNLGSILGGVDET